MAETVMGGAYQLPDGRWVNAAGVPISAELVVEAGQCAAARAALLAEAERARAAVEAERNPTARAIAEALGNRRKPAKAPTDSAEPGA